MSEQKMPARMMQPAPDFTAIAVMPDGSIKENFKLSDYRGKYVVLFFYPFDFTFVCPTEILEFNRKLGEFKERNCEVIGVSADSKHSHRAWRDTKIENGGIGSIDYPLVSDIKKNISRDYGVYLEDVGVSTRGTFLIDKEGVLQHSTINHIDLGRNVDETLRMVDALQHFEKYGEVCPVGWNKGDEAMKDTPESVAAYLRKHAM